MKKILLAVLITLTVVSMLSAFEVMKGNDKPCNDNSMMYQQKQHKMGNNNMELLCENLDLTDAQKDKIAVLRAAHQKKMIQFNADIDTKRVDKRAAMMDNDFAKQKKITGNIFDSKKQSALQRIDHHEAIWNILTPEQKLKANELRKEHSQSMGMRHKRMMADD
ncbi:MAG: Spy/CpxP family protein refolding chaperone [Candidatus Cloacimonetes bacterium]|nr:Spy/CpxP family protein refolding chaperone [Candidatus Cloacimonadota bacterium]